MGSYPLPGRTSLRGSLYLRLIAIWSALLVYLVAINVTAAVSYRSWHPVPVPTPPPEPPKTPDTRPGPGPGGTDPGEPGEPSKPSGPSGGGGSGPSNPGPPPARMRGNLVLLILENPDLDTKEARHELAAELRQVVEAGRGPDAAFSLLGDCAWRVGADGQPRRWDSSEKWQPLSLERYAESFQKAFAAIDLLTKSTDPGSGNFRVVLIWMSHYPPYDDDNQDLSVPKGPQDRRISLVWYGYSEPRPRNKFETWFGQERFVHMRRGITSQLHDSVRSVLEQSPEGRGK
jgi:hypothetical protein